MVYFIHFLGISCHGAITDEDEEIDIGKREFNIIELTESPDHIDEEDFVMFPLLDQSLYIGGELQFASEFKENYELDPEAKDDLLEIEPSLTVQLFCHFAEKASIFFENEIKHHTEYLSETGTTHKQWIFERTESWIFFSNITESGVSLQVGRQNYEDDRQWWWDEELDSIRVQYDRSGFHSEIAVAQEMGAENTEDDRIDPELKNIFRMLSHTAWSRDSLLRLDAFALFQEDHSSEHQEGDFIRPHKEDEFDADLFWYGIRMSGKTENEDMTQFVYWFDAAAVTGQEKLFEFEEAEDDYSEVGEVKELDVSGWGFDAGITWKPDMLQNMEFTFGYAWGSGDRNLEDRKDESFRQTGLDEWDQRFDYYGELLNPDLSNLHIITASVGFALGESSMIDLIYHRYRQDHPADFLWDSDLETDPSGTSKSIGEELDIALTYEEWDNVEIESSAAVFRAGDAFGDLSGEPAYRLKFEITYLF